MPLERLHDLEQLVIRVGIAVPERREREGVSETGDHVLALRVGQVVAVHALLPGRRVAGEADTGAAVVAEIPEDHRADVDGGAEIVGDALLLPVDLRPVGVPRGEDGEHCLVELVAGVLWEWLAVVIADELLVRRHQLSEVVLGEVHVRLGLLRLLEDVQRLVEQGPVHAKHRRAEHRQQPPIGVPGEPSAPGDLRQALHRLVVETDVQYGLHHPGHRELCA